MDGLVELERFAPFLLDVRIDSLFDEIACFLLYVIGVRGVHSQRCLMSRELAGRRGNVIPVAEDGRRTSRKFVLDIAAPGPAL